jgi:hypothetical protein
VDRPGLTSPFTVWYHHLVMKKGTENGDSGRNLYMLWGTLIGVLVATVYFLYLMNLFTNFIAWH